MSECGVLYTPTLTSKSSDGEGLPSDPSYMMRKSKSGITVCAECTTNQFGGGKKLNNFSGGSLCTHTCIV
jgi:hypothetical protein